MLWQPSDDSLFYKGQEWVKSEGGLWVPPSAAGLPFCGIDPGCEGSAVYGTIFGSAVTFTNNSWSQTSAAAIIAACEKFKAEFPAPPKPASWGLFDFKPSQFKTPPIDEWQWHKHALGKIAADYSMPKWMVGKPMSAFDAYAEAMRLLGLCGGYDIRHLPEEPKVTLHPHPRDISPSRASEITGGLMT